jgi:membrane-associated phospholipid phosphatase
MHTLFRLIQGVDVSVYAWLCSFHGSWFLDRVASQLESNVLFKSAVFVSLYWYFWFREGPDQQERRNSIVAVLVATLAGLIVARLVATIAPFRVRPIYDANVQQHPFSIPIYFNFVDWSAFPSDHAAYLGGLGYGLIRQSRRLTIPIVLYLAFWICLPRMYLGIHYASDIVAGTAIGIVAVWVALQIEGIRSRIARPLLEFMEAKPQVFYTAAFLIMFEMAALFSEIREPALAVLHAVSGGPRHIALGVKLVLFGCLVVIGIVLRGVVRRHKVKLTKHELAASDAISRSSKELVESGERKS